MDLQQSRKSAVMMMFDVLVIRAVENALIDCDRRLQHWEKDAIARELRKLLRDQGWRVRPRR